MEYVDYLPDTFCSARLIWHLFVSRRCYAVYDLRRQAPATTTTRIPDPRTYLPPAGCPTSFFYPHRLPQVRKEKNTLQFIRLFRYACPSSSFRCNRKRPSLSRVPPAVCPSLLESATTVCTSFLQSLSTYVHTPTPHSILGFRPAPQTPDLHTSNLPRSGSGSYYWFNHLIFSYNRVFAKIRLFELSKKLLALR